MSGKKVNVIEQGDINVISLDMIYENGNLSSV